MGDRILIVDDEPAFLTGYQLMLPQNWNVDTAVGGEPDWRRSKAVVLMRL
jgi:hypothetical protein